MRKRFSENPSFIRVRRVKFFRSWGLPGKEHLNIFKINNWKQRRQSNSLLFIFNYKSDSPGELALFRVQI